MERAYPPFGEAVYERLASVSVAPLPKRVQVYNLRKQTGDLRVDSVYQGDQDGVKGVYPINTVDCVTQYEGVATCERMALGQPLSEASDPGTRSPVAKLSLCHPRFPQRQRLRVHQPPRRQIAQQVAHGPSSLLKFV